MQTTKARGPIGFVVEGFGPTRGLCCQRERTRTEHFKGSRFRETGDGKRRKANRGGFSTASCDGCIRTEIILGPSELGGHTPTWDSELAITVSKKSCLQNKRLIPYLTKMTDRSPEPHFLCSINLQ